MTFSTSHAGYTVLDPPQVAPQEILQGAALPLHLIIIVGGSWPTAHSYLTYEVGPRSTGVKPNTAQTGDGITLETNGPTDHQQHGKEAGLANAQRNNGM